VCSLLFEKSGNCTFIVLLHQMTLHEKDGVILRERGCKRGNANYTCTETFKNKEHCIMLGNGEKASCIIIIIIINLAILFATITDIYSFNAARR